jgi:hypothetical protein
MNAETVLAKFQEQKFEGEKAQLIKELNALLLCTADTQRRARQYLQKAIAFIEQK